MARQSPKMPGLLATRVLLCAVCVAALAGCNSNSNQQNATDTADSSLQSNSDRSAHETAVRNIVASEELLLQLTPLLKQLNRSAENLQVPDEYSNHLFADSVTYAGIQNLKFSTGLSQPRQATEVAESTNVDRSELSIWPELFEKITYLRNVKFYLVRGEFTDQDNTTFRSSINFRALGQDRDQQAADIQGAMSITWQRQPSESAESNWVITHWQTSKLEINLNPNLLFREITKQLVNTNDLPQVLLAQHEVYLKKLFTEKVIRLNQPEFEAYFRNALDAQHPGLAVVDIDGDGIDELYICDEWKTNQFLKRQSDGSYADVAAEYGLDIDGTCSSAIFADFDNDGDKDVVIGRNYKRSLILFNDNGKFVESELSRDLPFLVSSVSCVDIDNDGLLDLYFCCYGFPNTENFTIADWTKKFLTPAAAQIVKQSIDQSQPYVNELGPPNVLLSNQGGGKFEISKLNNQTGLHHNTLQATWADYDNDGDQDLYVSNDFAPDFLLRNDLETDGSQNFVDVTLEKGGTLMQGFGMGASWADYNQDGELDLYVSNMYSKAGLRITEQIEGLDQRFGRAAEGNRLFHQSNDRFELASQSVPYEYSAAKAGWSWGGLFSDFNNDGYPDLYVSSGYYTAPGDVASDKDL